MSTLLEFKLYGGRDHICFVHECSPNPSTRPGKQTILGKYLLTDGQMSTSYYLLPGTQDTLIMSPLASRQKPHGVMDTDSSSALWGCPCCLGTWSARLPREPIRARKGFGSRKAGVRASTETVFFQGCKTHLYFLTLQCRVSKAAMNYLKYVGENRCSKNKRYSFQPIQDPFTYYIFIEQLLMRKKKKNERLGLHPQEAHGLE